jgi:hypothetical protein
MRRLLLPCLFLCLAACGPDVPHAKNLERKGLMRLVFPEWSPTGTGANQLLALPGGSDEHSAAVETEARIMPTHVIRLDETHAVMVTEAAAIDDDGEPQRCHACAVNLGAYFFSHDDKGWRLDARTDSIGAVGADGHGGDMKVARLGNAYVLFAEWGSCWQGYCGTWLEPFGFWPGKAKRLGEAIRLSAENSGAVGDCDANDPALGSSQPCYEVSGKWSIRKDQLVIDFKGTTRDAAEEGLRPPATPVAAQAHFALQGEALTLVSGTNPVPAF